MADLNRKIEQLDNERLRELESDWRVGLMPPSVIAKKYGVALPDLRTFAKVAGWDRGDLRDRIDSAATSALVERAVSDADRVAGREGPKVMDARETVRQYGQIVAGVVEAQRDDIANSRRFAGRLAAELAELQGPEVDQEAIDGLIALCADQNPELARLLKGSGSKSVMPVKEKLAVLAAKADILRALAAAQKTYIELERQAWALDKAGSQAASYDDYLAELYGEDTPETHQTKRLN